MYQKYPIQAHRISFTGDKSILRPNLPEKIKNAIKEHFDAFAIHRKSGNIFLSHICNPYIDKEKEIQLWKALQFCKKPFKINA